MDNTNDIPEDKSIESIEPIQRTCNFCGKSREQIFQLIVAPNQASICNECVNECIKIINQKIDELKLPPLKLHP